MATGYEVGMYRNIGLTAQALRGINDSMTDIVQEVRRLANAQERANELAEMAQEDADEES